MEFDEEIDEDETLLMKRENSVNPFKFKKKLSAHISTKPNAR